MQLKGHSALISGAGGPMGRAVAERFAREGASVIITDISGSRLAETAAIITPLLAPGAKVVAERGDITQAAEAAAVVAAARAAHIDADIIVNIVGGIKAKTMFEPMLTISEERWDATFALNTKGIFHLTKLLTPAMVERQYGKIINISSISFAGETGNADYGGAKAAVASLTRTMAMEFAPHVNVNCIAPGTIRTSVMQRMTAEDLTYYAAKPLLKRLGEPADIANVCLFLASDESSYITGEILAVSGGVWPAL